MRVRIEVTARDIRLGAPAEPEKCAVARALKRAIKGAARAAVGIELGIDVYDKGGEVILNTETPPAVQEFVKDFDIGRPVKPFAFTVNVPAKAVRR